MNPLAWILNALKVHPEPASFPEELAENATLLELAEARSRLSVIAQVTTDLRRQVDGELAKRLREAREKDGKVGALRYGEDIMQPSWRGALKIPHPDYWWSFVATTLDGLDVPSKAALLKVLFPANSVRVTGLKLLADLNNMPEKTVKSTFIHHDPPTSPLSVTSRSKAPKYLQSLEEGDIR